MTLEERQKIERDNLVALRDAITEDMSLDELFKKLKAFNDFNTNPAPHLKRAITAYLGEKS